MLLSRYFVFIHLPKTGGTFIRKVLNDHAPPDWEVLEVVALGGHARNDPNHPTIRDIPTAYRELPLFGFVRNPWDWYVSWYEFLKFDGHNTIFNQASDNGRKDFKTTMFSLYEMDIVKNARSGIFTWYFFESFGHNLDAVTFLRFEKLREDLHHTLTRVVELPDELAVALKTAPPVNVGDRKPYQAYYNEALRNLVASKDRVLIERFHYTYSS